MKQLQQLKLKEILPDEQRFLFLEQGQKIASVFSGIPLLWESPGGYIPVLPFSRENLGGEITALVYSADTAYGEILFELLEALRALRDLNAFDIAHLLWLLERQESGYDKTEWSRRLNIGTNQIPDYLALSEYQKKWERYLRQKNAPLKRILSFSSASLRERLSCLLVFNPGINVLEQISLLLQEIARRDKEDIRAVWESCVPNELIRENNDRQKEIPEKIRNILYAKRYPLINAYKEQLDRELQKLETPAALQVSADPFFEQPGIDIRIHAKSVPELEELLQWMEKKRKDLNALIKISLLQTENEEEQP